MSRCLACDKIFSLGGGEGYYRKRIRAAKEEGVGVEVGELGLRTFYHLYLHESFA